MMGDVTDADFEERVLGSTTPVLVDFWAEWCVPCHMVSPVVEEILGDGAARGVDRRPVAGDRVDRVEPDDPVDRGRDVALELAEAAIGPRPEDPVLLARVEPEGVQHPLELADVVTAERRRAQVQGAVAEPVAGLDELPPRVGPQDPVRWEPAGALELA